MAHAHEVQRIRRSAEQWRAILAEWSGSGLSQAEFCRQRGFSKMTFNGWKRHFCGAAAQCGTRLADAARPRFVEVATRPQLSDPALYEVRLTNGRTVRVGPAFDPATLRRLLAIVETNEGGAVEGRGC